MANLPSGLGFFVQDGVGAIGITFQDGLRQVLNPRSYGAITGAVSAQQAIDNVGAINACLRAAKAFGRAASLFEPYTIDTSVSPVLMPSGVTFNMNHQRLTAVNDNAPILVSTAWWENTAPTGRSKIVSPDIAGTTVGAGQHGIILFDYYSEITDPHITNVGGRGIYLEHRNRAGVVNSGSLVENRVVRPRINGSGGSCLYLGATDNARITDGYVEDSILRLAAGATESHIVCGSSAGWDIGKYHTYGGSPGTAVLIANAFNTKCGQGYIEDGWSQFGLRLLRAQRNISVQDMSINANSAAVGANVAAISVGKSTAFAQVAINFGSIDINANVPIRAIYNENPTTVKVAVANPVQNTGAGLVTMPGVSDTWFSAPVVDLRDNAGRKQLTYQGYGVPMSRSSAANLGAAQSASIDIPWIPLSSQVVVDVVISARANNNGAVRATYVGKAIINSKADTDGWVARLIDVVAPVGFSGAPTASVVNNPLSSSDRSGTLTVSFTYANADAYGRCHFLLNQEV